MKAINNLNHPGYIGLSLHGIGEYDITDKEQGMRTYINRFLAITQSMFTYDNLPETLPARMLELYMQVNGYTIIAQHDGGIYAYFGGLGEQPNEYYMPTVAIINNPYQQFSAQLKIDEECVVIPNDSLYQGLLPTFRRYASQLVENDITMFLADVNKRVFSLLSASDDSTREAARKYLADVHKGKLGIVADSSFLEDGIKVQPYGESNRSGFTDLIEYHQYIKASLMNDIGLNANYNMKREILVSDEVKMNEDGLMPFITDMLNCRKRGVESVNAMFGTNIEVRLSDIWGNNKQSNQVDNDKSDEEPEVTNDEDEQA